MSSLKRTTIIATLPASADHDEVADALHALCKCVVKEETDAGKRSYAPLVSFNISGSELTMVVQHTE